MADIQNVTKFKTVGHEKPSPISIVTHGQSNISILCPERPPPPNRQTRLRHMQTAAFMKILHHRCRGVKCRVPWFSSELLTVTDLSSHFYSTVAAQHSRVVVKLTAYTVHFHLFLEIFYSESFSLILT
ncbi:hypothetical protein J6590_045378 [Homalodisca vitripennis]|nr:hypothetical protein J6590_045378 [Homalodisca vitripennis]